jgi:cephalosporin hydroxylase
MKYETAVLQNQSEIRDFAEILVRNGVRSYLEVGSKFGGSLWYVANRLAPRSRVVSVDLPHGDTSFKNSQPALEDCVKSLKNKGYDAHLIIGDSTAEEVVEKVRQLGPFDAVFIDANHTLPYIEKDFANYRPMAKKLIALHDIGFFRAEGLPAHKKPIEVPIFWEKIKDEFVHEEIRYDKRDNGIGILWQ